MATKIELVEYRKRREKMKRLKGKGWTLQQLSDAFRISRQRVHQIVSK